MEGLTYSSSMWNYQSNLRRMQYLKRIIMSIAFPKTFAPIPKDWKKDLKFWVITPEKVKKDKPQEVHKQKIKRNKPIALIGKRKKERLKNEGSEVDTFRIVWEETPHICQECWKPVHNAFINDKLIKPQCFPHKLPKSMFPKLRLIPKNIWLVCSIDCHHNFDKKWKDLEVRRNFEQELLLILNSNNHE